MMNCINCFIPWQSDDLYSSPHILQRMVDAFYAEGAAMVDGIHVIHEKRPIQPHVCILKKQSRAWVAFATRPKHAECGLLEMEFSRCQAKIYFHISQVFPHKEVLVFSI